MPNSDVRNLRSDAEKLARTAKDGASTAASEVEAHARRAAGDIGETAELTFEQMKEQFAILKADLEVLGDKMADAGREGARDVYRRARRTGRKAVAAAEDGFDYMGEQFDDTLTRAETFTRERPGTALGLAAGAGFLLAMFLSRR
ncbi:MAG: YqjD family protein [Pseudorhodobacter sp.]